MYDEYTKWSDQPALVDTDDRGQSISNPVGQYELVDDICDFDEIVLDEHTVFTSEVL